MFLVTNENMGLCLYILGNFNFGHKKTGVENLRSEHTKSNTKRGTDLGTLVVPFDKTFHPLHRWE